MKLNLRHAIWAFALTFALVAVGMPTILAAQSEQGLEHGRGHNKGNIYANNSNYQQGWNHGQEDRANKRARGYRAHPDNDADRRAYESGYNQGYQSYGNGRNTRYGQYGQSGRNGSNRPYGNNVQNVAYNNGFQEGIGYGQSDRNNGHTFRPTFSSTYQNGTNGYNSSYGSETAYKNAYRDGYKAGYAQGYNSGYRR